MRITRNVFTFLRLYRKSNCTGMRIAYFLVISLFLFSCSKNNIEELWAAEEARLKEWINENRPDAIFSNGVYFYKIGTQHPENIQPDTELRDNILVDFICRFLDDDVVEEVSYKDWRSHQAQYPSIFKEGGPELWTHDRWAPMGLGQMREDEWANVYVPSRLLNKQDLRTRVYTFHLKRVINPDILAYQEKLMSSFMERFGEAVDTITISDNGKDYHLMYHVVNEGSGTNVDQPLDVNTRTSEFYFLEDDDFRTCFSNLAKKGFNGNVSNFSTKISDVFVNNPSKNNLQVRKGSKIVAVMPYRIMYHDKLNSSNGQYVAPLSSVLKYEIIIDN